MNARDAFSLHGKTLLVTGASSGIGLEVARCAAELGAQVFLNGRNEARLAQALASLPAGAHASLPGDVTSAETRERIAATVPALDGLVHAAGISPVKPFRMLQAKDYDSVLAVNGRSPMELTQALFKARKISTGASIVFVSSIAAQQGAKGYTLYSASKGMLTAFARSLAAELAPQAIRVNCVAPGYVRTPLYERVTECMTSEAVAEQEKAYPLGIGTPEQVALPVCFLLSAAASWMTGTCVVLDGGHTCS